MPSTQDRTNLRYRNASRQQTNKNTLRKTKMKILRNISDYILRDRKRNKVIRSEYQIQDIEGGKKEKEPETTTSAELIRTESQKLHRTKSHYPWTGPPPPPNDGKTHVY